MTLRFLLASPSFNTHHVSLSAAHPAWALGLVALALGGGCGESETPAADDNAGNINTAGGGTQNSMAMTTASNSQGPANVVVVSPTTGGGGTSGAGTVPEPAPTTNQMLPLETGGAGGSETSTEVPLETGGSAGAAPEEMAPSTAGSGGEMASAGGAAAGAGGDGAGGAGGAETASPTLGCDGSELLCEDFEGYAAGDVPNGGPWHDLDESCQYQLEQFSMGVSNEQFNGGSQSLKITNKHFAQCRLSGEFPVQDEFWVRAYMYWEPNLDTTDRETLAMDLTPGHRTADDPAVRFGYRSKAPCTEFAGPQVTIIGIGGGEATGCGSRELPRGEWYCFEAHVTQTGPIDVRTYINSEAITYQSTGKPETESVASEGTVTERIDHVRLGLFSTGEARGNVFVDDLAVSTERVGCPQ